jgi:hypothetical protein
MSKCPICGAPGGGPAGCGSCGLGTNPSVGRSLQAGQDAWRRAQEQDRRRQEQDRRRIQSNQDAWRKTREQERQRQEQNRRRNESTCFPGSSLVMTPDGNRRLDSIRAGDYVLTVMRDGCIATAAVSRSRSHAPHPVLKVVSTAPSLSFAVTGQHPVQTARGWIRAKCLRPGDVLTYVSETRLLCYHTVERVEPSDMWEPVYNLYIDGEHTYVVQGCVAHCFTHFRVVRCLGSRLIRFVHRSFAAWSRAGSGLSVSTGLFGIDRH